MRWTVGRMSTLVVALCVSTLAFAGIKVRRLKARDVNNNVVVNTEPGDSITIRALVLTRKKVLIRLDVTINGPNFNDQLFDVKKARGRRKPKRARFKFDYNIPDNAQDGQVTVVAVATILPGGPQSAPKQFLFNIEAPPLPTNDPPVPVVSDIAGAGYGKEVTIDASASYDPDGDPLTFQWTQTGGETVQLDLTDPKKPKFTTHTLDHYIALRDATMVVGISPRANKGYTFELSLSDGVNPPVKKTVTVTPAISTTSGQTNVPVGVNVFIAGKEQADYDWQIVQAPAGSTAQLTASRVASFIPDVDGTYRIRENISGDEVTINAGRWTGLDNCSTCHRGVFLEDKVTPWSQTGHSTMFKRGINGEVSSHYRSYCIKCQTVGYDTTADNGGFDDVADALGWSFPSTLQAGNWDAVPSELKNLANIQCENCHGPGSGHFGDEEKIAESYEQAQCGKCHDAPPHHPISKQWMNSEHSESTEAAGGLVVNIPTCTACHTAKGFVQKYVEGEQPDVGQNPAPITCVTCHDPHDATNEHQLRFYGQVELELPGDEVLQVDAGPSALCYLCHNAHGAAPGSEPHHPMAEMLESKGGYEFDRYIYPASAHGKLLTEKCIECHMPAPQDTVNEFILGGHTFAIHNDNGTPDDPSDDIYNVTRCQRCHPGLTTPDDTGLQSYVKALLDQLKGLLPQDENGDPLVDDPNMNDVQKQCAFNYYYVLSDGSYGVHSPLYALALLQSSIEALGAVPVPRP